MVSNHICNAHFLRPWGTDFTELLLDIVKPVLQLVLPALRFLQASHEILFRLVAHLFSPSRIVLVLLELSDPSTEKLIDDFEFADTSLERRVGCDKLLVGLGDFESMVAIQW